MNKLYLYFTVNGQTLNRSVMPQLYEGTNKFIHAKFCFSKEWNDMNKFALVARANETFTIAIDENNEALIAKEAIRTSGFFDMGLIGTNDQEVVITTNSVTVQVGSTEFKNNPAGEETRLTNDFLAQTLQEIVEHASAAQISANAARYAAEHVNVYVPEMDGTVLKWTNFMDKPNPEPVDLKGEHGSQGERGYSAYEIAVQNGFVGTVDQWLESLNGSDGENGKSLVVEQTSNGAKITDGFGHVANITNGKDGEVPAEQLAQIEANTNAITQQYEEIATLRSQIPTDNHIENLIKAKTITLTQAEYDALEIKSADTTYLVLESD